MELIPTVYDTPRVVRVMGYDGAVKSAPINQQTMEQDPQTGMLKVLNNLTVGKYDVTVDAGPSYTTQRSEAAQSMLGLVQAAPNLTPVIADKIVKAMDWAGAQEISKRLKAFMMMNGMGSLLTPEEIQELPQGPPQPPQPTPQQQMEMAMAQMEMEQSKLKTAQENLKVEKALMEVQKKQAEMGLMLQQFQMEMAGKIEERVGRLVEGDQRRDMASESHQNSQEAMKAKMAQTSPPAGPNAGTKSA